jgi:hypothetical protein
VQGKPQLAVVPFEEVEKRQVAILVRLLEHPIEVANRLMVVKHKNESQRLIHDGYNVV